MVQHGGMIYRVDENDYILGSSNIEVEIKERSSGDDSLVEYNQLDIENGSNSCTVHASMGAISDLTGYVFDKNTRQKIWNTAIEKGADPSVGWYFQDAVKHTCKFYNEFSKDKLIYFRMQFDQPEFWIALERKHSLVGGYRGNSKYNADVQKDGILDGTEFGELTYGHCIRVRKAGDKIEVIDNYLGKLTYNRYTIADFRKIMENNIFFPSFYLYLPEKTMTQDELDLIEAKKLGIWSGDRANDPMTRKESILALMRSRRLP